MTQVITPGLFLLRLDTAHETWSSWMGRVTWLSEGLVYQVFLVFQRTLWTDKRWRKRWIIIHSAVRTRKRKQNFKRLKGMMDEARRPPNLRLTVGTSLLRRHQAVLTAWLSDCTDVIEVVLAYLATPERPQPPRLQPASWPSMWTAEEKDWWLAGCEPSQCLTCSADVHIHVSTCLYTLTPTCVQWKHVEAHTQIYAST